MRRLLCPECASEHFKELCAEDKAEGWKLIKREIKVSKKPTVHEITVNGVAFPSKLLCDTCCIPLEGKPSVAVTMIRGNEPYDNWEKDYE